MSVNYNKTLTLGNNSAIKFMDNATLQFDGEEGAFISYIPGNVIFTSYRDDEVKGDSSGNGNLNEPDTDNGNWNGVWRYNDATGWELTFISDSRYVFP